MQIITTAQLRETLSAPNMVTVVEVLSRSDFNEGHLPGAINVPFNEEFDRRIQETVPGKEQRVVVYSSDQNSDASRQAAERMEELGFTDVLDYADGKAGWRDSGLPLDEGSSAG